jgi:hypothetical protein
MQSEVEPFFFFFLPRQRNSPKSLLGEKEEEEEPESLEASVQWRAGRPGQARPGREMGKAAEAFSGADFAVARVVVCSSSSLLYTTDGY